MAALTAIYVDFQCPYSGRAWRWLSHLDLRDRVEVRPYSMDTDEGRKRNPWDREQPSTGLELLALGEFARDSGPEIHLAYVDAAFAAAGSDRVDLSRPEGWLALGSGVGLDLEAFTADGDRWRAEVGLWHQEAEDELSVFGTPSLVFHHEHALWVKLDDDVTDLDAARRLLADLTDLVGLPVQQVSRTA